MTSIESFIEIIFFFIINDHITDQKLSIIIQDTSTYNRIVIIIDLKFKILSDKLFFMTSDKQKL